MKKEGGSCAAEDRGWDLVDRCLLPVVFSHALAVILSTLLNTFGLSAVSTFPLFVAFLIVSLSVTIFYHNLKVTCAGKCVLITDADSKIGSSAAKHLDELGFTVFAGFPKLGESSERLQNSSSGRLKTVEMDVASQSSVDAVYKKIAHQFVGLWAVINTSCWPAFGEVEWVPMCVFKKSADINYLGTVRVVQSFLPLVRKTKGRIVNVVSLAGRIPDSLKGPFCSVKSAVESFSDCLRLEMRRWGVDVVVIEPGHATTATWFDHREIVDQARDMWALMGDQARSDYGEQYFEQRIRSMKEYNRASVVDVSGVVKCIGDSIVRTFPLNRYTPITRQEKVEALVAHHLPRSVYEIIYC
ncbi:hypothetical protein AAG570_010954 [Ranatra chinensis]|uniref:D-beta-hydroxybutyrate dehydrogenase, mitochondrial n=1 Tax=Ranatra chinensis TaxID=642074 RepID=A0ABD0YJ73_9HEMI